MANRRMEDALCVTTGIDPDEWFPDTRAIDPIHLKMLKAICSECTEREQCLEEALESNFVGVWAGTTYEERQLILNRTGRNVARRPTRLHVRNSK